MHATVEAEPITVWTSGEAPARLVRGGERWRVIDRPTPLGGIPQLDGRAPRGNGWRVTMRRESDQATAVADLVEQPEGSWHLVHAWF